MVQDQLTEYISAQLKLGIPREAVKAALVGAGWGADDIEDTLKVVGSSPSVAAAADTSTMGGVTKVSPFSAGSVGKSIRVSDLISTSAAAGPAIATGAVGKPTPAVPVQDAQFEAVAKAPRGGFALKIIVAVVILALAGIAGYFYWKNSSLASKVASLGGESASVASQIANLQTQVQALDASNTALAAEIGTLAEEKSDLLINLSFLVTPLSAATGTPAEETVSLAGTLTQKKPSYILTTSYGTMVYVRNSTDAAVITALKPLVGSTSTVELTGTHIPGSPYLTVNAVNGVSL